MRAAKGEEIDYSPFNNLLLKQFNYVWAVKVNET